MIKKQDIKHFFINTLIYCGLTIGGYLLYNSGNHHTNNLPHTDFSFVYAQF